MRCRLTSFAFDQPNSTIEPGSLRTDRRRTMDRVVWIQVGLLDLSSHFNHPKRMTNNQTLLTPFRSVHQIPEWPAEQFKNSVFGGLLAVERLDSGTFQSNAPVGCQEAKAGLCVHSRRCSALQFGCRREIFRWSNSGQLRWSGCGHSKLSSWYVSETLFLIQLSSFLMIYISFKPSKAYSASSTMAKRSPAILVYSIRDWLWNG